MHTRPAPILRLIDKAGANRVGGNIAQGRAKVWLIQRHRAKSVLPEMPGSPKPFMDVSGIAAMNRRQGTPETILVGRREDQMHT